VKHLGRVSSQLQAQTVLSPEENKTLVPTAQEARWAPQPVRTFLAIRKISGPCRELYPTSFSQ